MASVNKAILIGNLGADPELRHTPAGKAVAEFRMATTFGSGDKAMTEWHRVVAWERTAEVAAEFLKKGSPVYVEGRIQTRSWDKDDGTKGYVTEIVVEKLQLLGARAETSNDAAQPDPEPKKRTRKAAKPFVVDPQYAQGEDDEDPFAA